MLNRTSIKHLNNILENNLSWKILDIGCGYRANKRASVIADIKDYSDYYKEKKFIQIKEKNLPFKDKEFDFVIASHVIEHVEEFEFFIKEFERISSKSVAILEKSIFLDFLFWRPLLRFLPFQIYSGFPLAGRSWRPTRG